MDYPKAEAFLGERHDAYLATDPRKNKELGASLKGQHVLVAGAGRGIGRACAKFLTHASAKSITLLALEQNEVDETAEHCKQINPDIAVKALAVDVKDATAVKKVFEEVDADFGGLDVLLMNAGRPPQWLITDESDPAVWWDTVAVSLQGAFNCSRYALPLMKKGKGGRIIFTSSSGAHTNMGMGSYAIGKLGMVRLAEIIHVEYFKEHNIKAFAYHPGAVKTRFFTDFEDKVLDKQTKPNSYVEVGLEHQDKSAKLAVDLLSSAIWDAPELAAGLVTILASGKMDFMSGRYVDASKDVEEYMKEEEQIKSKDLHRVRLHVGEDHFIPTLDF